MNIITYYFQKDGKTLGPVTQKTLIHYQRKGFITPTSLIRTKDSEDWVEFQTLITPQPAYISGCAIICLSLLVILAAGGLYHKYRNNPEREWERAIRGDSHLKAPVGKIAYFNVPMMGTTSRDELHTLVSSGAPYPTTLNARIRKLKATNSIYRFPRQWKIISKSPGIWIAERRENYALTDPWSGKRIKTKERTKLFYIYSKAAEKHFSHAE